MITSEVSHLPKFKDYFRRPKSVLRAFGVSLFENESVPYRIYSFVVLAIFYFLYVSLAVWESFKEGGSVIGDATAYQLGVSLALAKTIMMLRYRSQFQQILVKLEQKLFQPNPERGGNDEEKLIGECLWMTNIQTLVYLIMCLITNAFGISYAMIQRMRNSDFRDLPYGPITVLNITNTVNFEITCVYQGISIYYLSTVFCMIDCVFTGILSHVSYQFKILQNNYRRLVTISYYKMLKDENNTQNLALTEKSPEDIDGSKIPWKYLKEAVSEAVDYHLAILDLANEIEEIFSTFLLFLILGSLILYGFLIFRASQMAVGDPRLFITVGLTLCGVFQVLLLCYWAEEMTVDSENVGLAAYESNFAGADIRFQKSLVLVIRRSLNSTVLTAGKFAPIRLTTFIWIMRSGYTAFMMLRNTRKEDI